MDILELRVVDVPDRAWIEGRVRQQVAKLERHCDHITSCHVAIERPNAHPSSGSSWRVRIEVRLAGAEPFVVRREPGEGHVNDGVATILSEAFGAADRKAKEVSRLQRG